MTKRTKNIIFLFCISFLIVSCSTASIYKHGHWYLRYKIYQYTSLHRSQINLLEKQFAALLDHNKKYDIPNYIAIITRIQDQATHRHLSKQSLQQMTLDIQAATFALYEQAIDYSIPVLQTISHEQVQEIKKNLTKKYEKSIKIAKEKGLAFRQNKYKKKIIDKLEDYMGGLNKKQISLVENLASQIYFPPIKELQDNLQLSLKNIDHLEDKKSNAAMLSKEFKSQLQQPSLTDYNKKWIHFFLKLQASATTEQLTKFRKTTQSLILELQDLHKEATNDNQSHFL